MDDRNTQNEYQWPEAPRHTTLPMAREGLPLLFAAGFATAVFALLGLTLPALFGLLATGFIGFFFRDPDRIVPRADRAVVSPADGKVILAEICDGEEYFNGKCLKVSIFMSIFNVHVNRAPIAGEVRRILYTPGAFFRANLDKSSRENEHNAVFIETEDGIEICVVQIAGLVARRIVCRIQKGDRVLRGQRFGMICFGSRLDLYLPPETEPAVHVGQRVQAGASILGHLH